MFILTAGLRRTGVLDYLTRRLLNYSTLSPRRLLLLLAATVPLASAFINNTPIVIIMVPVLLAVCRRARIPASKLFIPVSYLSILGGTCTLMGTSTNILVDDLFRKAGGPGFWIFDFTPLGLIYLAVGAALIILLAPRLLPERASLSALLTSERSAKFVTELVLQSDSPLVGERVSEILTKDSHVHLLELIRGEEIVLAARAQHLVLEPNDALIVEGSPKEIAAFISSVSGVELASVVEDEQRVPMKTLQLRLVEAVVLPDSPFVGRVVKFLGLNRLYGVKVMAVQRHGRQHRYQIRAMKLQPGDVLLLQADDHGLAALHETGAVLIVEGVEETIRRRARMPIALAIMAAVVVSAGVGVPMVTAAFVGAALMMLSGCIRVKEALRSLDSSTLPRMLIACLYMLTSVLTAFLSNNAVAVLLTPIVINIAAALGVNPKPLLMAVAFGASASFATPVGYQTNTIVMGPGGYTFGDYLRVGVPLSIITWITATILIPIFWPF
jgi:di/tricarboxylate transporter